MAFKEPLASCIHPHFAKITLSLFITAETYETKTHFENQENKLFLFPIINPDLMYVRRQLMFFGAEAKDTGKSSVAKSEVTTVFTSKQSGFVQVENTDRC